MSLWGDMRGSQGLKVTVVLALALILSACANVRFGQDFDLRVFETRVQHGVTTRAEVRDWLGEPKSTGISVDTNGRRFEEWTYLYGQGRIHAMQNASFKILQIKFDQQGLVQGYEFSAD